MTGLSTSCCHVVLLENLSSLYNTLNTAFLCWALIENLMLKPPPEMFCKEGILTCNFMQKRLQYRRFSVNIAKFLRTPILKNICEWKFYWWKYFMEIWVETNYTCSKWATSKIISFKRYKLGLFLRILL